MLPCGCLRVQSFGFQMLPHLLSVKAVLTNIQVNIRTTAGLCRVQLLTRGSPSVTCTVPVDAYMPKLQAVLCS